LNPKMKGKFRLFLDFIVRNIKQPEFLTGFSVIEVLFVVVVMGILAAVVIPRLGRGLHFDRLTVYTITHQISADTRLARRMAITNGQQYRIRLQNTGSNRFVYFIERNNSGTWVTAGAFPKTIPQGISVGVQPHFDYIAIFNIDGSADAEQQFTLTLNNYRYQIEVIKNTGRVKFYKL